MLKMKAGPTLNACKEEFCVRLTCHNHFKTFTYLENARLVLTFKLFTHPNMFQLSKQGETLNWKAFVFKHLSQEPTNTWEIDKLSLLFWLYSLHFKNRQHENTKTLFNRLHAKTPKLLKTVKDGIMRFSYHFVQLYFVKIITEVLHIQKYIDIYTFDVNIKNKTKMVVYIMNHYVFISYMLKK